VNFHEQRRFPRVSINGQRTELSQILGAQLAWPNLEVTEVLDLSYKGLAARRPGLFPLAVRNEVTIEVRLGMMEPFTAAARVAWCNLEMVGMELKSIPSEGHQAMGEFLDAKLAGTVLRPVERALFSADQNFHIWFQGTGGLHVFIWTDGENVIERVVTSLNDRAIEFQRGARVTTSDGDQRRGLLILSQIDVPGLPMEEFMRSLGVAGNE
jgi:hypothetical protein